jgi:putative aldouronate transport system substrate-binding protein
MFGGVAGPFMERMHIMRPLTGPEGVSYVPRTISLPGHSGAWQITRDAAHPFEAFQIGEWFMSDYGARTMHSGQFGVHWTSAEASPEVAAAWTGRFQPHPTTNIVFRETNVWGQPGNTIWGIGPRYLRWNTIRGEGYMPIEEYESGVIRNWNQMHYDWYAPLIPHEVIGRRVYSEEEMTEVSQIEPLLMTHIVANNAAFAVGNRPMSEFDAFLSELEAMGLSRFIQLSQNGHDRARGLPPTY